MNFNECEILLDTNWENVAELPPGPVTSPRALERIGLSPRARARCGAAAARSARRLADADHVLLSSSSDWLGARRGIRDWCCRSRYAQDLLPSLLLHSCLHFSKASRYAWQLRYRNTEIITWAYIWSDLGSGWQ